MPRLRKYRIFISHSWDYGDYHKIKQFLDSTPNFIYTNYSVPDDNALNINNKIKLKASLRQLIRLCQIVLVPAGMEVNFREFVLYELSSAQSFNKPIVGIMPWGARQMPRVIREIACEVVGWNRSAIVRAIRRNAM